MGYKVVITTNTGDEITADDSVVERQGTAVYKQICNKEDVLFKDSNGHTILIPFVNIVEANVNDSGSIRPTNIEKPVNFIDYDGTITNSYTAEEFAALTSLPENPSHEGLVAQGWNWSLADAKAYLQKYPMGDMNIGQMYITESGDTEIDIVLDDPVSLTPYLGICIDGEVEVDWGDGSEKETITGTSLDPEESVENIVNTPHTYSEVGEYTISIHVVSGSFAIAANSASWQINLLNNNDRNNSNYAYCNTLRAVRLGTGVELGYAAFSNFYRLEFITMPSNITYIGEQAFYNAMTLRSIVIPAGITSINKSVFSSTYKLESVSIPNGVTELADSAFSGCYSLRSLTIPDTVVTIGECSIDETYALRSIIIPDSVTRIEGWTFEFSLLENVKFPPQLEYIGDEAFVSTHLTSVELPNSVTEVGESAFKTNKLTTVKLNEGLEVIGDYAFSGSYFSITIPSTVTNIGKSPFGFNMTDVHVKPLSPPTMAAFGLGLIYNPYLTIYVPYSEDHSILAAYKAATNWSYYSSKMQEEPE